MRLKNSITALIIFTFLMVCSITYAEQQTWCSNLLTVNNLQPKTDSHQQTNGTDSLEIKTFETSVGWGYDIFVDGKKYIHQEQIPSVPGTKGFKSEEKARKAAEFIIYKIRNNIMPPSVTPEELDSLGVL